jgi:hypothetical protein
MAFKVSRLRLFLNILAIINDPGNKYAADFTGNGGTKGFTKQ